jgi:hypothetical protein
VPQNGRRPEDIQREIAGERERIAGALNDLGNDVDDLVTELRQDALDMANRALIVAPLAGAAFGALLTAVVLRRRRKKRKAAAGD